MLPSRRFEGTLSGRSHKVLLEIVHLHHAPRDPEDIVGSAYFLDESDTGEF
jgi:hypothetical protein